MIPKWYNTRLVYPPGLCQVNPHLHLVICNRVLAESKVKMNSSTPNIGAASKADLPLEGRLLLLPLLMSFLNRYRPELDMLWVVLTYSPFLVPTYEYLSTRKTRFRKYPHPAMLAHILVAPLYILRWHARYAALRAWPQPEVLDLVLFAAFWASSVGIELSRTVGKGRGGLQVPLLRAGFQVAVALHGLCFAAAWYGVPGLVPSRDPAMFRATVKFFNWFASFRLAARLVGRLDPELAKSPAAMTSLAMMMSASYALWEAGLPNAVPVFMAGTGLLVLAKRTLAERMAR